MTKTKIPGIRAIQAYFKAIVLSPNKEHHVIEAAKVGGAKFMVLKAQEMIYAFSHTNNPADLDMAIQFLSTARLIEHGPVKPPVRPRAGKEDSTRNSTSP